MKAYLLVMTLALAGCVGPGASKPSSHSTPPASVLQISDELELASVRLTAQAEKRLGVSVVAVKRQEIASRRPYPGTVVMPPQSLAPLLAPVTGVVRYIGPEPLAVGTAVSQGQPLFCIDPLIVENFALGPTQRDSLKMSRLTVEQSVAAIQTRINNAKVELEASQIDLRRAEQLFEQKVGSRKRVDDAKAREALAQETLDNARREQRTLTQITGDAETRPPSPVVQVSPMTGTILNVTVSSGQSVSVGQPLLQLTDLKRLWIRVRIPQAEVREIQRGKTVQVSVAGRQLQAEPVPGAPTADPLTSTLDLYYGVENWGATLSPDQRVEVSLPLKGSGQHLVVPTASVLYDIYGGTWVYVRTKPLEYRRVRVLVDFSSDQGQAVLSDGPEVGAAVAVHGSAELFGIEFGND